MSQRSSARGWCPKCHFQDTACSLQSLLYQNMQPNARCGFCCTTAVPCEFPTKQIALAVALATQERNQNCLRADICS